MAERAAPSPLAAAIKDLRLRLGLSHDAFAVRLGVPKRQTVIRWEKQGARPKEPYRSRLVELGVDEALWEPVVTDAEISARLAQFERDLAELRRIQEARGRGAGGDPPR